MFGCRAFLFRSGIAAQVLHGMIDALQRENKRIAFLLRRSGAAPIRPVMFCGENLWSNGLDGGASERGYRMALLVHGPFELYRALVYAPPP